MGDSTINNQKSHRKIYIYIYTSSFCVRAFLNFRSPTCIRPKAVVPLSLCQPKVINNALKKSHSMEIFRSTPQTPAVISCGHKCWFNLRAANTITWSDFMQHTICHIDTYIFVIMFVHLFRWHHSFAILFSIRCKRSDNRMKSKYFIRMLLKKNWSTKAIKKVGRANEQAEKCKR